jgi:hypothetical protein
MTTSPSDGLLLESALAYARMGYAVFPCVPGGKAPATKHGCKDATTDESRIRAWWQKQPNANIGLATAGLIVVDVDGAENPWLTDQPDRQQALAASPLSLTPSGGRHHVFRQPAGKSWGNSSGKLAPKVDTRGNGGYIVAPPSVVDGKAYRWAEGFELLTSPAEIPEPPPWLVEILDLCRAKKSTSLPPTAPRTDDADRRAVAYLNAMPPSVSGQGGHNAAYAAATAMVHGFGLAPEHALAFLLAHYNPRCQPPWSEGELRHKVDDAVSKPHDRPLGWLRDQESAPIPPDVDLSGILAKTVSVTTGAGAAKTPPGAPDPGPMPDEMLRVPGFISEVMDHCIATAPYPNSIMAFCGALALQAFLAGRKVRDPGDNRTNVYLLALAHSSAGKDHPRKINTSIVHQAGLHECLGVGFASGEGIQDALFLTPCMLFQTDEIDSILQQINKAKDARHEAVMSTLLTIYSTANSVFPMRRKAGKESPGVIDQPCLSIFGTAIPNHYYAALSERMLTNGFFARMLIAESGPRQRGQEPRILDLPPRVIATAKWWADFRPGTGNLENWHPVPAIVEHTDEAKRLLIRTREESEDEYAKAESRGDAVGTTVWGRVSEQTRKLALIHAVSENHTAPRIDLPAVEWATRFVMHQTRRMLFMAAAHVAENPFHAECLRAVEKLRGAPGRELPHSVLLKRMKMDAKNFAVLIETLRQQGEVEVVTTPRPGAHFRSYRLVNEVNAGGEK